MLQILIEGFILGLSTGTICLMTCAPIYLPYLISEDRKLSKGILTIMEISVGRFFSYLAFGAVAGYTGAQISSIDRELFTSIAYILLSAYLILSAVRTRKKDKKCYIPKLSRFTKNAFILGILTGVSFCPPFLIALSKAVNLGGAFSGMMLFLGFFFGTSVFLMPLAFVGQLSKITKMKLIAQFASIFIAVWFTFSGVKGLVHTYEHKKLEKLPSRIVEAFHPQKPLVVFSSEENKEYFSAVRDSSAIYHHNKVHFLLYDDAAVDTLDTSDYVLFVDSSLLEDKSIEKKLEEFDYFFIENNYPISRMLNFLRVYTFKTHKQVHWEFKIEK
jgi:sulfite exporter TauE/SafE